MTAQQSNMDKPAPLYKISVELKMYVSKPNANQFLEFMVDKVNDPEKIIKLITDCTYDNNQIFIGPIHFDNQAASVFIGTPPNLYSE